MQENHLSQNQVTLKKALARLASSHVTLPLSPKPDGGKEDFYMAQMTCVAAWCFPLPTGWYVGKLNFVHWKVQNVKMLSA